MKCPHCQRDNPDEAKFCMYCGRPPDESPPIEVLPTTLAAERRLVTVMFADISGFTALVDRLGPEDVRSLINDCFDQLVPVIETYGGVIDKFIGDEIMALFGAPTAHEDDPVRALRAALDMLEALVEFNQQHDTDLGMHIGINTGSVVSGGIGSRGRQQYSVIGSGVNLAARLRSLSQRGEILLGPDTYRFATPLFEFEPLEHIRVKGNPDPVPTYKLLGRKDQPGRLRGLTGLSSPMVGRDRELNALLEHSTAVQAGQGRVVVVIGEPGLGKSRLMAEWRAAGGQARIRSALRWVEGRCLSYGQGLAYHLLIDLLHNLTGIPTGAGEPATRAALLALTADLFGNAAIDIYPYLGHLLSLRLERAARERVRSLDPQAMQAHYLAALRQLLQAQAVRVPLILILEDTHWADPSSIDLLVKLLALVDRAPLIFCLVTRPNYDAPGWKLVTAARELERDASSELHLTTLSKSDSQQLVANLLQIQAFPEEIRQIILQKAEGNPFFVEEVIRTLIDREVIVKKAGRWIARQEIEAVDIPDNLQSLLLARIDRLPDEVKHTLRVASIIGRQFSVRVLEDVLRSKHGPF